MISDLFLKEINYSLTASCACLSLQCYINQDGVYNILLRPSSVEHNHECGECTVDMSTGTLHVNTEIYIDQQSFGPNKCSLIFQWTSKTKTLSAPDKLLLQKPQPISSMPIFIDFLPALESLKPTSPGRGDEHGFVPKDCNIWFNHDEDDDDDDDDDDNDDDDDFLPALESLKPTSPGPGDEHDYFIVPKLCNVCYDDDFRDRWRKSWCMAELQTLTLAMSDKHRRCYQIMKYLSEARGGLDTLRNYDIKTVALRHHTTCSDTTDDCVECVMRMLLDLRQAFKTNKQLLYQSNLNTLNQDINHAYLSDKCEHYITMLCSVSDTDTWETFIRKWKILEDDDIIN